MLLQGVSLEAVGTIFDALLAGLSLVVKTATNTRIIKSFCLNQDCSRWKTVEGMRATGVNVLLQVF
jgi:hypothetical protein